MIVIPKMTTAEFMKFTNDCMMILECYAEDCSSYPDLGCEEDEICDAIDKLNELRDNVGRMIP